MKKKILLFTLFTLPLFSADVPTKLGSLFDAVTKIKPSPKPEAGSSSVKIYFEKIKVKDCTFLKKVTLNEFSNPNDRIICNQGIELLKQKTYAAKGNVVVFEFMPINCDATNLIGFAYFCKTINY